MSWRTSVNGIITHLALINYKRQIIFGRKLLSYQIICSYPEYTILPQTPQMPAVDIPIPLCLDAASVK
jgi:hypothetical protein